MPGGASAPPRAVALAEAGADVVVSARTGTQLEEVAARVEAAGRRAWWWRPTVEPRRRRRAGRAGQGDLRPARHRGQQRRAGPCPNAFFDTTTDYLEEAFQFNVATAHALSAAAVPLMLEGDGGVGGQHLLGSWAA